ncbi:MAG TPA: SCE4755 family polysaccharide monooxygenase-like protein [Croceibacterium sp.]
MTKIVPARPGSRRPRYFATAALLAAGFSIAPASAHFVLESPAASLAQNAIGDPQKLGPCGGTSQDAGTPTGAVTELTGGSTLHLKLREAVYHPGHYRVALARAATQLPDDPVTVTREGPRGPISVSAEIAAYPAPPVLADGLFQHTAPPAQGTFWEADLRVPNVDCKDCIVQVIQWMAEHPGVAEGGYSYHHCATVSITRDPALPTDDDWAASLRN